MLWIYFIISSTVHFLKLIFGKVFQQMQIQIVKILD